MADVNVREFISPEDAFHDYAFAEAIAKAGVGGAVSVPKGDYHVTTGAINMVDGMAMHLMKDSVIHGHPSNIDRDKGIIAFDGCKNATLFGQGRLNGKHGALMGVVFRDWASDSVVDGIEIVKCRMDGLYFDGARDSSVHSVKSIGNGRQGLSGIDVDGLHVELSEFSLNGPGPPGNGIDLEPDEDGKAIHNVHIVECLLRDNIGASHISIHSDKGTFSKIEVVGCTYSGKPRPIWVGANAGELGEPPWADLLYTFCNSLPGYRWWGFPRDWKSADM